MGEKDATTTDTVTPKRKRSISAVRFYKMNVEKVATFDLNNASSIEDYLSALREEAINSIL